MKVNNEKNIQMNKSIPVQPEKTETVKQQRDKHKADSLSISSNAAKIAEATKIVTGKMDEIRVERVQQLQKEIEQGTYKVDRNKLADAMLTKAGMTTAKDE